MSEKNEYYSLRNILSREAYYYIIFGERSNGKTYAVLKYALERYFRTGEQLAIIRRWDEDFIGADSARYCYDSLMHNGDGENEISNLSNGEYTGIEYYSGRYYLTVSDGEKTYRSEKCVAIAFAINSAEHYKSSAFPYITTILFDEFITRKIYIRDEFIEFENLLSTIIRRRNNVKIFMCANTVNKYGCPYFTEMGLTNIKHMKQGQIDVYTYGESGLRVAVEYSDSPSKKGKKSDVYFAFDNPRLNMITGGTWEMAIYPHLPKKYADADILFTYFIKYSDMILQCEIIQKESYLFTFIHRKTTPIKYDDYDVIFALESDGRPNHITNIAKPTTRFQRKIWRFFADNKVFYQDNEIGEIVRSYLNECKSA